MTFRHMPLGTHDWQLKYYSSPRQRAPSQSCSVPWRTLWSQGVTTWTVACTTTHCGSPNLLTTRDSPRNSGNPQKEYSPTVDNNGCLMLLYSIFHNGKLSIFKPRGLNFKFGVLYDVYLYHVANFEFYWEGVNTKFTVVML